MNFAADIPARLAEADELLYRYGRWAMYRQPVRTCGSAEGRYIPERGEEAFEARREPREVLMGPDEAMQCQRALANVPDRERVVLTVLYIPRRQRIEHQLRVLRLPPRLVQDRHITGLTMFRNLHEIERRRDEIRRERRNG